jgi:basic amino acid/polyamine antiporter, APA family
MPKLLRRLGARDAALIVMGGIVGSGIFRNPSVVAKLVPNAALILGVWAIGGAIALLGAAVFAELAARRPHDGGVYAYLREAFHPVLAFLYGWTLLLVSQSGGMAAAAVTFAGYVAPWTGVQGAPAQTERILAITAIGVFTAINALGVRQGANTQNLFMILKIAAVAGFIAFGLFAPHAPSIAATLPPFAGGSAFAAMGLALVPVLFAYAGWQTSSFMSAELRDPARTLPMGLLWGVSAVIVFYIAVNAVSLRALGVANLAATDAPASAVAQLAFGSAGSGIMTVVVALSTLGFLSNQILTSPRVYFQMATDGVFFKQLAWVHPRTHVPVVAIVLQGAVAAVITLSGAYDQILNYILSVDFSFFGLSALALIVFRNRDARDPAAPRPFFTVPGQPWTTLLFLVVIWSLVGDVLIKSPAASSIGLGILLSGVPVYFLFAMRRRTVEPADA